MLRIITDSASDITQDQAEKMKIEVIPIIITFDDGVCKQEKEADFEEFYHRLERAKRLPVTSQPSPQLYLEAFNEAKICQDEVIVITLSSGLSGTFRAAWMAKQMCEYESIYIIDSRQAIMTQRMLVEYAVKLRKERLETGEIVEALLEVRDRMTVCGIVGTLTYLRKGGRIPSSLAVIGNTLNIKPVIILEDATLKTLGKARGFHVGKKRLYEEFERADLDLDFPIYFGYTADKEAGETFRRETAEKYQISESALFPVGGVIGTHVGPGCIAIAFVLKKETENENRRRRS